VPSLRSVVLVRELERSFSIGCERAGFRLAHYSLQSNHAHFIVEAADRHALGRGMKSLAARLARAANRVFRRRGPVLADRYHARPLKTPREVHRTLGYVLLNARRHARRIVRGTGLDPASSARWFDGWRHAPPAPSAVRPVARARTWLLRVGWRRHGLLDPDEVPGPRRPPTRGAVLA
jgi:putative transposase